MGATLHTKSAGDSPAVPARWYSVSRIGAATLCVDERDARRTAAQCDVEYPSGAPHRALLMGDVSELLALVARFEAWLTQREAVELERGERTANSQGLADLRAALAKAQGGAA